MRDIVSLFLFLLIPGLVLLHLLVAPYTKVEESFHIQAIHDIETYGIPSPGNTVYLQEHYDHFKFPGAVPRTFIGALMLSGLSQPVTWLNEDIDRQNLARAILGFFNASALMSYASGIKRAFGQTTAIWYLLFQASQFHVLYYASRTLSNMFAFGISTLALRFLLPEPGVRSDMFRTRCRLSLSLLTVAGIIFRSELSLFLATHTLFLLVAGRINILRDVIPAGILGLFIGLASTVSVDSFFWQQFPLWPELAAFKFNVVSGQASAWGTQPWHFYFSSAIPRLLLNPCTYVIGIPVAFSLPSTRAATAYLLTPSLAFVVLFSFQPHKEWRFILYAIPPLTAAAALGASYIWTHRTKSLIYRLLSIAMLLSPVSSFTISTFFLLPSSAANYPGAHALRALHNNHADSSEPEISVYLGNLACQTGVTRFLQIPSNTPSVTWKYDKTEDETIKSSASFWDQFDYALVEATGPEESRLLSAYASASVPARWENVEVINGFAGVKVLRPGEKATGSVEERVFRGIGGERAAEAWEKGRELVRKVVTRGWWVQLRMEPKIKIMRRVE